MSIALGGCLKAPPIQLGLTEDTGGHLTYLWGAAAALSKRSDVTAVEIVTRLIRDADLGPEYAVADERIDAKLHITRVETGDTRYLSKENAAIDRPRFIAALIRMLSVRKELPDIVHAHFADGADVAIALRERFGIPFVFTAHSLAIDKRACGLDDPALSARINLEEQAIGAADAIVASSRDEAERQIMLYSSADAAKIWRIPPGAVITPTPPDGGERTQALLAPFLRVPEKPMLLAIARPVWKKNLPGLVDLYAADPALRERANLVILAGLRDGPDSGGAEQRAVVRALLDRLDRHDLYGSLALPKRHDQADVGALYRRARETGGVFVNPALTEPYGLTLTEAAHHGLPVVATCHGGAADIVATLGHGHVADPRSPKSFGAAIHRLLDDPVAWRNASIAGRENSKALSWTRYAERFAAIASGIVAPVVALSTSAPRELLLSDIDNTLTGCRKGARDLIGQMAKSPTRAFGIATGRSVQEARRILEEWSFPLPRLWVTSVGSEIYWSEGGRLRADRQFARLIAQDWKPEAIASLLDPLPGLTRQADVEQRRFKRSWFAHSEADAEKVRDTLDQAGLNARVIFSHGRLLDVIPARAGKGAAMHWVRSKLQIDPQHVYAAGDSGNDLDMLAACANAILVANHSAELASLVGRPGIHLATRPHAGGIVEVLAAIDRRPALEHAA